MYETFSRWRQIGILFVLCRIGLTIVKSFVVDFYIGYLHFENFVILGQFNLFASYPSHYMVGILVHVLER